ncbi:MAG TPA: hypothetical protein VL738_10865 [Dactylosporangium sp.]|jgi:hypothetical protein|nr:hypothetical protein [Dactylosporangium sp.]
MGNMVVVLWTASLVVAIVVGIQRDTDPVVRSAARLGFAVSLAGMLLGFLMTMPTGAQQAELDRGGSPAMIGAHSVGVADGGPSMPVTGWSSAGGDLRVPHFTGIHALQALPLLGCCWRGWPPATRPASARCAPGCGWCGSPRPRTPGCSPC